jgi:RimJ/RimL family protein N-acetyltransferase
MRTTVALRPTSPEPVRPVPRLAPLAREHAGLIASWAQDQRAAEWLAPRTPPPLDAAKVLEWQLPGVHAYLLYAGDEPLPLAYGEVNELRRDRGEYWLGHLVVAPARRGQGWGRDLTRLLLRAAFNELGARRVTLVVFPENRAAVRAYEAAGMVVDGYETHFFAPYGRTVVLVRMVARA